MVDPGLVIEIMPPQLHMHLHVLVSANLFPIISVGSPGAHGVIVTGTHGCGVKTPKAAAVAEATAGFAIDWHMPKGIIFIIG